MISQASVEVEHWFHVYLVSEKYSVATPQSSAINDFRFTP